MPRAHLKLVDSENTGLVSQATQAERDKRIQLNTGLLHELETLNERVRVQDDQMFAIESMLLKKLKDEIEGDTINLRVATQIYRGIGNQITISKRTRLDIYDRLSGNVGLYPIDPLVPLMQTEEESITLPPDQQYQALVLDQKQRREAEKLCYQVVQLAVQNKIVNDLSLKSLESEQFFAE